MSKIKYVFDFFQNHKHNLIMFSPFVIQKENTLETRYLHLQTNFNTQKLQFVRLLFDYMLYWFNTKLKNRNLLTAVYNAEK